MPSMLLIGSCATHSRQWFRVVANHASMVIKPFSAHDHHEKAMLSSATLSNSVRTDTSPRGLWLSVPQWKQ